MQIDVVSDTVCPWCFIGKRRLERALKERPKQSFTVTWRPFRLDPSVPPEGYDRKEYMRAKFGDGERLRGVSEALRQAGESVGIAFDFEAQTRRPDTLDSHRLIRWAGSAGVQQDVAERLFRAYFEEGKDIGAREVLLAIAREAGMDTELVAELLAKDADRALIEREDEMAHRVGISGVPTFIFANRYAISGAQDPATLVKVIDKVLEAEAA